MNLLAQTPAPLFDLRSLNTVTNPFMGIYDELLVVSFVLFLVGFIMHAWRNREETGGSVYAVLNIAILVAVLSISNYLAELTGALFTFLGDTLRASNGGTGLNSAGERLRSELLQILAAQNAQTGTGIWARIAAGIATAVLMGYIQILTLIGGAFMIPFFFLHALLTKAFVAFAPICFGCMSIPAMRDKAVNFLMMMLSVFAWPLGFSMVDVAADWVWDLSTYASLSKTESLFVLLITPTVSAFIIIVGTILVPLICYFIFTSGSSQSLMGPSPAQTLAQAGQASRILRSFRR